MFRIAFEAFVLAAFVALTLLAPPLSCSFASSEILVIGMAQEPDMLGRF